MTPETFFENFALLADAPNGVPQLRALILQFAVQGKLVPQDPTDEPASVLLGRIRVERAREDGKQQSLIESEVVIDDSDEVPYDIPGSWSWLKVQELAVVMRGISYKKHESSNEAKEGYQPILRANNIDGEINFDNLVYIPDGYISKEQLIRAQDIVIAISSGSKKLVGKAAQIKTDFEGSFGAFCGLVRVTSLVDRTYVGMFFHSPLYRETISSLSRGIGINNLQKKDIENILIPLPPLTEQRRIVAKVDQLMALCDELETRQQHRRAARTHLNDAALDQLLAAREPDEFAAHWQRLRDNFDLLYDTPETIGKLRQAILQLAVQGKLVPQDQDDEPASMLLERIRAEKARLIAEGKLKKEKPLLPITEDEKPFEVPNGWEWVHLDFICHQITDGTHYTPTYTTTGVPFLSVKDISGGKVDLTNTKYISQEEHEQLTKRCKPEPGDVLLTKVGTTGIAKVIDVDVEFSIFVSLALLKFTQSLLFPHYLELVINSPLVKAQSKRDTQGIGNKNLVLKYIQNFVLPLPPLAEQRRIVAKVDQLMVLCDELEAQLKEAQGRSGALLEAVVRQVLADGVTAA